MQQPKLGIIAGGGTLPLQIIEHCEKTARPFLIFGFHGQTDPTLLLNRPHLITHLGQLGPALKYLKSEKITEIILAGHIRRPSLRELKLDFAMAKLIGRIGLKSLGDDGVLRAIKAEFNRIGIKVIAVQELLPNLLLPAETLTKVKPNKQALLDIQKGFEIATTLGKLDIGQAVVMQQGLVLGVEAIEGTDALIERCGKLARKGERPVLIKIKKPQQDQSLDLPTLGKNTIENLIKAGFAGVAGHAHHTLLLQMDEAVKCANKSGLFITGIPHP